MHIWHIDIEVDRQSCRPNHMLVKFWNNKDLVIETMHGLWQACKREIVVYSLDEVMPEYEQAAGKFLPFLRRSYDVLNNNKKV